MAIPDDCSRPFVPRGTADLPQRVPPVVGSFGVLGGAARVMTGNVPVATT
jgi:hypothetical protein